jgi:hypothetical protein
LKPGSVGRLGIRGWNRAGLKKKWRKEKPGVTRRVDQRLDKTRLQPVDFLFFLLKRYRFDFFKNN